MEKIKNNKVVKTIGATVVFGMALTLTAGIMTIDPVQADDTNSKYAAQVELAQKAYDKTREAHYSATCSLAQAKQIARAHGVDIEGNPNEWDNMIQECLGKNQ